MQVGVVCVVYIENQYTSIVSWIFSIYLLFVQEFNELEKHGKT